MLCRPPCWGVGIKPLRPLPRPLLQVQSTIGRSDYVRRDNALKGLIQPLAGEYGMHNGEAQGALPPHSHIARAPNRSSRRRTAPGVQSESVARGKMCLLRLLLLLRAKCSIV